MKRQRTLRHRGWLVALAALLVLGVAFRVALNPVARLLSHRVLDSMAGYQGDFDDVSLSLLRLRYQISGLTIARDRGRGHTEKLQAKAVEARLQWRDLWRFRLGGVLRIDEAKATYAIESRAQLHAAILGAEAFADLPDIGGVLEALIPFRINRVEIRDSQVLVIDRTEKDLPDKSRELWLHGVEATVENVGNRSAMLHGEPATLALAAKLQRSGELSLFMTLDPLAYKLDFEGEAAIRHLNLEELYGFVVGLTALQAKRGVLDAFATFRCGNGYLAGTLKPILTNLAVAATDGNAGNHILAAAGNAAIGLASSKGTEPELATVIPFGGRVIDPQAHVWPALLTMLGGATAPAARKDFAGLPDGGFGKGDSQPSDAAKAENHRQGRPPLSTSPEGLFGRGAVPQIQAALTARGFPSSTTGTLEGATQRHVLAFQVRQKLPGTGFPDRETLRHLGLEADALYRSHQD